MASAEVKLVLSTVSDGRARDLRFRQNQFHSLHRWITTHAASIEAAARNDDRVSDLQTKFMVSLTLRDLKKNYEELDLKQALQAEYCVKNGRNNAYGSIPEDLIYIIPERYTPFYSVLTALFACIAAGSCCLIEIPTDLTHSVAITRQCLTEALDKSAYVVISTRPSSAILKRCLVVDQLGSTQSGISRRVLKSHPQSWTVAIVDRDTNLELAAREIYSSRIFSGKSPYAPNCILVNEFVEKVFVRLLREQISTQDFQHNVTAEEALVETVGFKVVKVSSRVDLEARASTPTFTIPLLATSSHDDAIDAIESHHLEPLLALYVFAAPHAAKYLTQFIRSDVSFVNHIPANLLVGPAAPLDYHVSLIGRYSHTMMEVPNPKFVNPPSGEPSIQQLTKESSKVAEAMYSRSLKPLPPTGQPKDGDRNFFAQGLVTGVVVLALPLLVGTVGVTIYVGCEAYRTWR